jgi:TonB family protein
MLQFILASALLSVAALAAERLLRLWKRQARAVWAVAMIASVILSAVSLAQAAGLLPNFALELRIAPSRAPGIAMRLPAIGVAATGSTVIGAIAVCWALASAGLTIRFARAARRMQRRRAEWRPAVVDGQGVLVSSDAGPAVIGFRAPVVVIPEWVLAMDAPLRALVLRHEREHLEGGDPRLLLGAVAVATLAPWNLVLWFQLHRLRSAMELDCDQRVLRAHPDARRYGSLLLAVAQRADRGVLLQAALTESSSLLMRRITAMRQSVTSFRITQTLLLSTAAALAGFVACEVRSPTEPAARQVALAKRPIAMPADQPYFEFQVENPVTPAPGGGQPRYPDALRVAGVNGEVLAQFIVGPDGRADVESFRVLKSSNDLFTQSVRKALPQMRFKPALVGGKPVRQLVQQPFTFTTTK